ncbi:ribosomal RNA small subunit methyltransferase A [Taibaiella lutea]|uniref:Ribosomal RNA small subunit methyltransferase A n=1 Tax=Taibaiella lutea TaxID=2608001 RepID=A0A5M6CQ95_9BACT|nr:16S rRNA (adenine(1518)-N(6)/adenine(1519)-N(6))-dimethyltransferase RsmA [Taibaiella lutea]KAA5537277.1 ribosomal RNA small subunit methyltransferase A [Taibaiella lutea]
MALTLKKSLGQHFLHDENMCRKIVEQVNRFNNLQLLEIGPGGGAITKYLLQWENTNYKAIEVDDEKVEYLPKAFPAIEGKLIHKDFLKADKPFEGHFSIIGNFPYNISTQILFKILDWEEEVDEVIGMFQKEVAQRVASKEGSKVYGILSVLIQAFFTTEYLFDVPPGCFNPPPKVMSGILKMTNAQNPYKIEDKKVFLRIVKAAFNQRRKMLRNALKGIFSPEALEQDIFTKRAEQLLVTDFVGLYNDFINQKNG